MTKAVAAQQPRQNRRREDEGSGGVTMKQAVARRQRQQRHDKEGSGGATMKAAAA